jgi:hypothetical protein
MGYFERRFVRPTRVQMIDALEQAAREANESRKVVASDRDHWDTFLTRIRDQAEGFRQWRESEAGVAGIAWWTDHLRRRHFRVWAGSSRDGSFQRQLHPESALRREEDALPPIWHIAPDRVFQRIRNGRRQPLVVCACGQVGTPEAVGWMGDCCASCHERTEEKQTGDSAPVTAYSEARRSLQHLTFSPDGRWLAGAGTGVCLWDVVAGAYRGFTSPGPTAVGAVTFSPDSRLLAVAGGDRMLRFVDVATRKEVAAYPAPKDIGQVAIAPDDRTLAIAAQASLEVWGRAELAQPWLPIYSLQDRMVSIAFDSGGDLLAVGGVRFRLVLRITQRGGQVLPSCDLDGHSWMHTRATFETLAFGHEGSALALVKANEGKPGEIDGPAVEWWDEWENPIHILTRPLYRLSSRRHFSPDVSWLASIDGTSVVLESVGHQPWWHVLRSSPRPLSALAFSPDNETLATADREGVVKLWPWRRLLEA